VRETKSPEGDGCELSCDVCYWVACWCEGGRTCNVHLGSAGKMDAEAARRKARAMKADAFRAGNERMTLLRDKSPSLT